MVRSSLCIAVVVGSILSFSACHDMQNSGTDKSAPPEAVPSTDKAFVAGGKVDLDLDAGSYEIKAAADNHIRVAASDTQTPTVDVGIDGNQANVKIKNTPHRNFHAIVEVPAAADVVVRLSAGELTMGAITGNKDVESTAGNVEIAVGDPNNYAQVDTAVKAGDIDAHPFGGSKSGLMQSFTWSGPGKHTLRAHVGAGNLTLTTSK